MSKREIDLTIFLENPWKSEHLHCSYSNSFLAFSNMPEYGPSEMLLASLYRRIGLRQGADSKKRIPESHVGKSGTTLRQNIAKALGKKRPDNLITTEGWQRIIEDVIRSPKTPKQGKSNFIQTTPIVPSAAIYSMAARLRGNPWNPGALIESSLCYGEATEESANNLWKNLFDALSVKEGEDDGWAVYLEQEFASWNCFDVEWVFDRGVNYESWMGEWQEGGISCPARRFTRDLQHILDAKSYLTRRQWTSLLEALLRIGLSSHVLWISKVNSEIFAMIDGILKGGDAPELEEIASRLSTGSGYWNYGQLMGKELKKIVRDYVYGRLGLNMVLHRCEGVLSIQQSAPKNPFSSLKNIQVFLASIANNREAFGVKVFHNDLHQALESDPRKLSLKEGTGNNMIEFFRHTLGQRETQEKGLEGYDQGYFGRRRGGYQRAPLVLEAGPVTILALVHACTSDGRGIRTVEDFCNHLGDYGIRISPDEVADSKLGKSLRNLGLVLDSPDAEGGMVLLNPFKS